MKKEKKNEILHVICIFHWQMIWLPGKFDNFKWQWQLATPTPTSIHPTYPFPLLKEGTTTNSAFSTSAAAAIYAFKWRMMMFTIIMRMMMMMHLYLVYLVSFICRMHFAVALIVKCAAVLFLSRKQHGAPHQQNVYFICFLEPKLFINSALSSKGFEKDTYILRIYIKLIPLRVWLKQLKPVFGFWYILINSLSFFFFLL